MIAFGLIPSVSRIQLEYTVPRGTPGGAWFKGWNSPLEFSRRGLIICGVSTKDKDRESISYNQYKYYVSVEIASNDIMESVNNALSNDEVLKVDYNYEKFKQTFEEEMNKMRSGN